MIFTMYEGACAIAELNNEELFLVARQLKLPPITTPVFERAKYTYMVKISLIKDKQQALDNIMKSIDEITLSSNDIITLATKSATDSFKLRQNLELSVLESQLKQIEIEIMNLKGMTASDFAKKYGA